MNTQLDPGVPVIRPMYWSLRRELWEHRSVFIAPLVAGSLGFLVFLISLYYLPASMRVLPRYEPSDQLVRLSMPYSHASMLVFVTAFIVGIVYCLDALHGERRDRSILFWKSLPVSDLTAVLAKATVPLVVLPLVAFAVSVAIELIMLVISLGVLLVSGGGTAAMVWTHLPIFQLILVQLYTLPLIALWYAPIYGWLLLVSGWARRTPFLWAVLPLLAIAALEKIAFSTSYFASLIVDRLIGFATHAFNFITPEGTPIDPHFIPVTQLAPGRFLSTPGLWIGLVFAVLFLAAAVRLRRYREPI